MAKYVKVPITKEMEEWHDNSCSEDGDNCEQCPCRIGEHGCVFGLDIIEENETKVTNIQHVNVFDNRH